MQGLFFARRIRQPPVRMPCVRISSRCMSSVAPLRSTARPLASPPPPPEASPLPGTPQPPGASALSPLMPHPQTQNGLAARLLLQPLFPRLAPLSSRVPLPYPCHPAFSGRHAHPDADGRHAPASLIPCCRHMPCRTLFADLRARSRAAAALPLRDPLHRAPVIQFLFFPNYLI